VRAFDVRPEVAEQIESMGAAFVTSSGGMQRASTDGYAQALTDDQAAQTARVYAKESAKADIVLTTALVRGQAPTTITADMVANMKAGSVIVDLAASGGGNCELTVPGEKVVTDNGVTIIGYRDFTSRMPAHTSQLFGTNIVNLLKLLTPTRDGQLTLDMDDVVQRSITVTQAGEVRWPPPPIQVSAAPPPVSASRPAPHTPVEIAERARRTQQRRYAWFGLAAVAVAAAITFSPTSFLSYFTVFVLAVVVGFYVISNVSASLHTPLMAQTNAISGIILVGALLQLGSTNVVVVVLAFVAATVASINIFGGFGVAGRMISMFRKDA
jgi:NAD(P) transhydrogenase subunit alpha